MIKNVTTHSKHWIQKLGIVQETSVIEFKPNYSDGNTFTFTFTFAVDDIIYSKLKKQSTFIFKILESHHKKCPVSLNNQNRNIGYFGVEIIKLRWYIFYSWVFISFLNYTSSNILIASPTNDLIRANLLQVYKSVWRTLFSESCESWVVTSTMLVKLEAATWLLTPLSPLPTFGVNL